MAYSAEIFNCITTYLDSDDWKYTFDEEYETLFMGLEVECKLKSIRIYFDLRETSYLVYAQCPLKVDEGERAQMRELLNRINYDLLHGNFEMDESDGEVRFRYSVDCENRLPSQDIVENSLYRGIVAFETFGDAIAKVLMGFGTAKEAYEDARNA